MNLLRKYSENYKNIEVNKKRTQTFSMWMFLLIYLLFVLFINY